MFDSQSEDNIPLYQYLTRKEEQEEDDDQDLVPIAFLNRGIKFESAAEKYKKRILKQHRFIEQDDDIPLSYCCIIK